MTVLRPKSTRARLPSSDSAAAQRRRRLPRVDRRPSGARPVRSSHRSETARPTAASAAVAVSVMRNGVGNIGSVPPVISTSSARSSDQPAIGRRVRSASLVMLGLLLCNSRDRLRLADARSRVASNQPSVGNRAFNNAFSASSQMHTEMLFQTCRGRPRNR